MFLKQGRATAFGAVGLFAPSPLLPAAVCGLYATITHAKTFPKQKLFSTYSII
jgi:hypothetical protein